jgi:uncharacterized protein (TIGR03066 family)
MKAKLVCVLLACVALSVSGCGSSPQDQLVGKWEAGGAGFKMTAEFTKDGKATLSMFGQSIPGTYKVIGSDELEVTLNGEIKKYKMKVTATELELTGDGQTVTYKKV